MASTAHERVNSQGFPGRLCILDEGHLPVLACRLRFVKAKSCICCGAHSWDSAKDSVFYLRRSTAVRRAKMQFSNMAANIIRTSLKPCKQFSFSVAQTSKAINQFEGTWVASTDFWLLCWHNQPHLQLFHFVCLFVKLYMYI